jgi:hypothetical protein
MKWRPAQRTPAEQRMAWRMPVARLGADGGRIERACRRWQGRGQWWHGGLDGSSDMMGGGVEGGGGDLGSIFLQSVDMRGEATGARGKN